MERGLKLWLSIAEGAAIAHIAPAGLMAGIVATVTLPVVGCVQVTATDHALVAGSITADVTCKE